MNYDSTFQTRVGAKVSLTAQFVAPPGQSYQITGGSFTLYDSVGNAILGPVAVTGFNTSPQFNPQAYYLLDTTNLTESIYTAQFQCTANWTVPGAANEVQTLPYSIGLTVLPGFQGAPATYPVGTPLGDVRFYAGDTNVAQAVFSDDELNQCLVNAGQVPTLAASLALEAAASDNARLAVMVMIGEYKKDATKLAAELQARAQQLRSKVAQVALYVSSPNQVFFPAKGNNPGNMTNNLW